MATASLTSEKTSCSVCDMSNARWRRVSSSLRCDWASLSLRVAAKGTQHEQRGDQEGEDRDPRSDEQLAARRCQRVRCLVHQECDALGVEILQRDQGPFGVEAHGCGSCELVRADLGDPQQRDTELAAVGGELLEPLLERLLAR